ncbi:GntR family transcriptional regulator [Rhodobacteraceae bacterium RKSG542]|uniref:GntR family transcriptional regulator n=1 Tax=Pseudovibrio flavus TaxID=2529854 RepID=UPI0012BBC0B4|nr:GntR family transcriptional regulator [Pseudovibrio flavus]MTI17725.1 GntR family transcriptional regulator [Pseudovibrio flavus]
MGETNWIAELKQHGQVTQRKSLAEEAADTLREFILLEKLAPGTAIPERELADALGISRTPLREALRLLVTEGLVEYSATRRPRVAAPSMAELTQYITVLGALEALAGELVCNEATDEEINGLITMERRLNNDAESISALEFFQRDMRFHSELVALSRNEPLIETHRQYNARLWRARFISSKRATRRANTLAEHRAIAVALGQRDPQATAHALRAHLKSTISNIAVALEGQADG